MVWEWFQNLSVVATCIGAVYGLWKVFHGRTALKAKGSVSIFKPLPRTVDEMQTFYEKANELVQARREATKRQHPDPIGEATHELLCHIPQTISESSTREVLIIL
jgi:hypothetical protein